MADIEDRFLEVKELVDWDVDALMCELEEEENMLNDAQVRRSITMRAMRDQDIDMQRQISFRSSEANCMDSGQIQLEASARGKEGIVQSCLLILLLCMP